MINLGDEVRDIVTGFEGLATGRAEYLFNGPEIQVQPRQLDPNGEPLAPTWIREARLECKKKSVCLTGYECKLSDAELEEARRAWDEANKTQG